VCVRVCDDGFNCSTGVKSGFRTGLAWHWKGINAVTIRSLAVSVCVCVCVCVCMCVCVGVCVCVCGGGGGVVPRRPTEKKRETKADNRSTEQEQPPHTPSR